MPVYHFTFHAYRNWRPDHKRGYTQRRKGYKPPDPEKADEYDNAAGQEPAHFTPEVQRLIIRITYDFCQRRKFRFHAAENEDGHTHLVLSWRGFCHYMEVIRRLKNVLATELNRTLKSPGRRWFVRGGSRKRVSNDGHLDHLKDKYLPDHPGIFWREERPLP